MSIKILISDPLSEEGINILKIVEDFHVDIKTDLKPQELKEIIKDYDALIVRSATKVTKEIIDSSKNLKVIGRAGVGLDNVDLESATQKGIIVMNTPAGNTISTAEHTFALILALSRNIPQANNSVKRGEWKRSQFMGVELYNKVLGIIGLGRIGSEVAKRAQAFGMRVLAYDPYLRREIAQQLGVEIVELRELLTESDYITVHTPLTEETKHIISDEEFALMKDGVRIINCARGGVIDEKALLNALKEKKVAGAALDVFEVEPPSKDSELLKLDNVIVSCHLGASTEEAQRNVAVEIAESVRDYLLGKGIRNAVNFPCLEIETYKVISPYLNLAERLGCFGAQIIEGRIQEINLSYNGEIFNYDITPLTSALVKGLLTPVLGDSVNFINALSLAKERAIKLKETKSLREEEFINSIELKINTDLESRSIIGTLSSNKQPRIVKIDKYYVEVLPYGQMIITYNWDRPGIIGNLGTLLGSHGINIAAMTFGREEPQGKAISILNVDNPISQDILDKIKKLDNILSVKLIKL
ncbi:MAG: phosphoglycerate dehydrogenase [Candidatus Omnitrophica bacterium]|nr:phosphoglycerate dehydrogenase [Candidatus Omnitrophota bacterium]